MHWGDIMLVLAVLCGILGFTEYAGAWEWLARLLAVAAGLLFLISMLFRSKQGKAKTT